jgi:hypothetical protein
MVTALACADDETVLDLHIRDERCILKDESDQKGPSSCSKTTIRGKVFEHESTGKKPFWGLILLTSS